jgi:predicted glycosyltransferase involved in capsule biosynthesis
MKTDLSKTSIIIHYRKDSEDRAFNLKTIVRFLSNNVNYGELIIINDSSEIDPEMHSFSDKNGKYLFFKNDGHFKKAYGFNEAASIAKCDILCFYDVDILIEPKYIKMSQDAIIKGEFDHIYPFNGTFINIKKENFNEFLDDFNFSIMKGLTSNELASSTSPGGCNLISRQAFSKIGGYDQDFVGWGFEDTDFFERSKKINRVKYLDDVDAICWHLEHDNAIRVENPHYNNNLNKFIKNNRIC